MVLSSHLIGTFRRGKAGIRLKAIRDGIQDYEYAHMLKNLAQLPVLDTTILPIVTSWTNWNHDPNALQNARTQLLHHLAP